MGGVLKGWGVSKTWREDQKKITKNVKKLSSSLANYVEWCHVNATLEFVSREPAHRLVEKFAQQINAG